MSQEIEAIDRELNALAEKSALLKQQREALLSGGGGDAQTSEPYHYNGGNDADDIDDIDISEAGPSGDALDEYPLTSGDHDDAALVDPLDGYSDDDQQDEVVHSFLDEDDEDMGRAGPDVDDSINSMTADKDESVGRANEESTGKSLITKILIGVGGLVLVFFLLILLWPSSPNEAQVAKPPIADDETNNDAPLDEIAAGATLSATEDDADGDGYAQDRYVQLEGSVEDDSAVQDNESGSVVGGESQNQGGSGQLSSNADSEPRFPRSTEITSLAPVTITPPLDDAPLQQDPEIDASQDMPEDEQPMPAATTQPMPAATTQPPPAVSDVDAEKISGQLSVIDGTINKFESLFRRAGTRISELSENVTRISTDVVSLTMRMDAIENKISQAEAKPRPKAAAVVRKEPPAPTLSGYVISDISDSKVILTYKGEVIERSIGGNIPDAGKIVMINTGKGEVRTTRGIIAKN